MDCAGLVFNENCLIMSGPSNHIDGIVKDKDCINTTVAQVQIENDQNVQWQGHVPNHKVESYHTEADSDLKLVHLNNICYKWDEMRQKWIREKGDKNSAGRTHRESCKQSCCEAQRDTWSKDKCNFLKNLQLCPFPTIDAGRDYKPDYGMMVYVPRHDEKVDTKQQRRRSRKCRKHTWSNKECVAQEEREQTILGKKKLKTKENSESAQVKMKSSHAGCAMKEHSTTGMNSEYTSTKDLRRQVAKKRTGKARRKTLGWKLAKTRNYTTITVPSSQEAPVSKEAAVVCIELSDSDSDVEVLHESTKSADMYLN